MRRPVNIREHISQAGPKGRMFSGILHQHPSSGGPSPMRKLPEGTEFDVHIVENAASWRGTDYAVTLKRPEKPETIKTTGAIVRDMDRSLLHTPHGVFRLGRELQ
jgi:hypothetical protein